MRASGPVERVVRRSLQPCGNLVPRIQKHTEVSRSVREPVICDTFFIRDRQVSRLPTSVGLRDPEIQVNPLSNAAANPSQSSKKFAGRNDNEAGLVLEE
jgi:hypothetical protein